MAIRFSVPTLSSLRDATAKSNLPSALKSAATISVGSSPTGKELWTLWIVPTDGSPPIETELQHELANAGAPRLNIHPDGKRVVYVAGGSFRQFWALRDLTFDEPGQAAE